MARYGATISMKRQPILLIAAFAGPGSYRIEDVGSQLFSKVSGDYFTILGLPLLPLLEYLRVQGALQL